MTATIIWIDSPSWELDFFSLPHRIPWPAEVDAAQALQQPFPTEHLLTAIQGLGPDAGSPWQSFALAAEKFDDLAEALEESEIPRAGELLDEIEALHPGTSFTAFHRAHVARHEGREADAIALYTEAAQKTPRIPAIWVNLGAVYASLGKRNEAVAAFRNALQVNPNEPTALEGLTALREVIKLKANDPRHPDAYVYMDVPSFTKMAAEHISKLPDAEQLLAYGEQLLKDGVAPEAGIRAVERANELQPDQPRTVFVLASGYHHVGQPEKARQLMERYVSLFPNDVNGFYRLAQTCRAVGDAAAERAAIDRVLELDPNFQPALTVRFELTPREHDPKREDELSRFGAERGSWMAHVLAGVIARERGDTKAALRHSERALELSPENEEALLHYSSALGDVRDLSKLASVIKPAVESGKHSKRLEWNYAQVLHELGLVKDAVGVLAKAAQDAPDDFKQMASVMIDAWTGTLTGCGVRLEVNPMGMLLRPILITLPDGDGGVVLQFGSQLPAEGRFPWRATGPEATVALQQGHSGAREPRALGNFRIRGITLSPDGPTTIDCRFIALPDGLVHFRAIQNGRKLGVGWEPGGRK